MALVHSRIGADDRRVSTSQPRARSNDVRRVLSRLGGISFGVGVVIWLGAWLFGWGAQLGWLDQIVHALATFGVTLLMAARVHRSLLEEPALSPWNAFLLACAGLGVGALWEMSEGVYDRVLDANLIKGKYDTMMDLLADGAGAVCAVALVWVVTTALARDARRRPEPW